MAEGGRVWPPSERKSRTVGHRIDLSLIWWRGWSWLAFRDITRVWSRFWKDLNGFWLSWGDLSVPASLQEADPLAASRMVCSRSWLEEEASGWNCPLNVGDVSVRLALRFSSPLFGVGRPKMVQNNRKRLKSKPFLFFIGGIFPLQPWASCSNCWKRLYSILWKNTRAPQPYCSFHICWKNLRTAILDLAKHQSSSGDSACCMDRDVLIHKPVLFPEQRIKV